MRSTNGNPGSEAARPGHSDGPSGRDQTVLTADCGGVAIGCVGSGPSYSIVIDAVGDDDGILAAQTVIVP